MSIFVKNIFLCFYTVKYRKLFIGVCICICMVKVISLSDNAYAEMKSSKRADESFSDVALRLIHSAKKQSLDSFFGRWPGSSDELDKIKETLRNERAKFKTRGA